MAQNLSPFPSAISDCVRSHHHNFLDVFAQDIVSILLESATQCIPSHSTPPLIGLLVGKIVQVI